MIVAARGPHLKFICAAIATGIMTFNWTLVGTASILPFSALVIIMCIQRVRMPRVVGRGITLVAASSLFIYLTHGQIRSILDNVPGLTNDWAFFGAAMVGGILAYGVWNEAMRLARAAFPKGRDALIRLYPGPLFIPKPNGRFGTRKTDSI